MKRPFEHSHADDDDIGKLTTSASNPPPIVIEVDECACIEASVPLLSDENPPKRARTLCDCTSLNLLVKAMERISRVPSESGFVKVVDRVPSMCHEVTAIADCRSTSDASRTLDRAYKSLGDRRHPPPMPIKSIVYYKRPSATLHSSRLLPVLPLGRPLMAPPRLPTSLRPGQIMRRNNKHKEVKR
jgi:hypothetical protein